MSHDPRPARIRVAAVSLAMLGVAVWGASGAAASPRAVPPCSGSDLAARVTGSGAGMSQPAVYVTVTNTGSASCFVKGYPSITGAWTRKGKQSVSVTKGDVMNAPETKPTRIVLAPSGKAWFAIGAATAYDPPVVTFRRMSFSTSAGSGTTMVRSLGLQASAPSGEPFPIGVTAFAAGRSPGPE